MEKDEVEEESAIVKFLRKTYLIVIALFLIFLLLINTNAGYQVISVLNSKIVSSTMENYSFRLKSGGQVIFDKGVYDQLKDHYLANQKAEFKACLTGDISGDYHVTGLYFPRTYAADVYSVTAEMCNSSAIISLHSHPPLRCIFSDQDMKSYEAFLKVNPQGMIALMCEEDRLTFHRR